jgi:hypothetical protein
LITFLGATPNEAGAPDGGALLLVSMRITLGAVPTEAAAPSGSSDVDWLDWLDWLSADVESE